MDMTMSDQNQASTTAQAASTSGQVAKITEGTLKNGEKVYVNGVCYSCIVFCDQCLRCFSSCCKDTDQAILDHVYVAAPWDRRDPVPYSIGRIMEFIPPEDASLLANQREANVPPETGLRCRIAWFYRPTDVQDKGVGDHRLLLAAMFSEITPFSNVRGKCIVRHRDKITDLQAYKKKEDHFYFYQLFDPFTKDNYEIILAQEVHNRWFRLS